MKETYRPMRASLSFNLEDGWQKRQLQEMLKIVDYQLLIWNLTTQNNDVKEVIHRTVDEALEEFEKDLDESELEEFYKMCEAVVCRVVNKLAEEAQLNFED